MTTLTLSDTDLTASPLAISTLFLPQPLRPAVMAVNQLLSRVVEIPEEVSEPAVGAAKLAWWKGQLLDDLSNAVHPDLQRVYRLCPVIQLKGTAVDQLVETLNQLIQKSVFQDTDDMWQVCMAVGQACLDIECQLLQHHQAANKNESRDVAGEDNIKAGEVSVLAASHALHFFLRLLHNFASTDALLPWPFPLQLQARHQMNSARFHTVAADDRERSELHKLRIAMCRDLLREILQRLPAKADYMAISADYLLPSVLMHHLEQRLLRRYLRKPEQILSLTKVNWSPLDVLSTWWCSQSLMRQLR